MSRPDQLILYRLTPVDCLLWTEPRISWMMKAIFPVIEEHRNGIRSHIILIWQPIVGSVVSTCSVRLAEAEESVAITRSATKPKP